MHGESRYVQIDIQRPVVAHLRIVAQVHGETCLSLDIEADFVHHQGQSSGRKGDGGERRGSLVRGDGGGRGGHSLAIRLHAHDHGLAR